MPVNASLKTVYEAPACSIQGHHCFSEGYPQVFSLPVQISKLRICEKKKHYLTFAATQPGNQCNMEDLLHLQHLPWYFGC